MPDGCVLISLNVIRTSRISNRDFVQRSQIIYAGRCHLAIRHVKFKKFNLGKQLQERPQRSLTVGRAGGLT